MRITNFIPAFISFIASVVLLTLPANYLPHTGLFGIANFDKLVHFGMFFMLTVLFCLPFLKSSANISSITSTFNRVVLGVILYGIIMEFVQKYFTLGRSFDLIDILFDGLGTVAGLVAIRRYSLKKIGPDKNRGRNQN